MLKQKISLFVVLLVTVSLLAGVVPAQAAVKWKFSTSDGKKKAAVNASITLEKQEFCDMNLYRNGKLIKESDATYKVSWYTSDKNVVYVDKQTGKLRADKFGQMSDDTATAKITAVVKNMKTGSSTKKSFNVTVVNRSAKPTPTNTPTPKPTATPTEMPAGDTTNMAGYGDGKELFLETIGVSIPTLASFNTHALENININSWVSDRYSGEDKLEDVLYDIEEILSDKGITTWQSEGFMYGDEFIAWSYWRCIEPKTAEFVIERDPDEGIYTLTIGTDLVNAEYIETDIAPWNRDILKVFLSVFTGTVEEAYDYLYTVWYKDKSVGNSSFKTVPGIDCLVRIDFDNCIYNADGSIRQYVIQFRQAPATIPTPTPSPTPEPKIYGSFYQYGSDENDAGYSTGKPLVLENIGTTIPTLSSFNEFAFKDGGRKGWIADTPAEEEILHEMLHDVRYTLIEKEIIHWTCQAFLYRDYCIIWTYLWGTEPGEVEFALKRNPSEGTYTLFIGGANLIKDEFEMAGIDFAPYNRDLLKLFLSIFSSEPEELYDFIYRTIHEDSSICNTVQFVPVGDCAVRFNGGDSGQYTNGEYLFVYEFRALPTTYEKPTGQKDTIATSGSNDYLLEELDFNLPLLDYANTQGLEKGSGWFGDKNHAEYKQVEKDYNSVLNSVEKILHENEFLATSADGFKFSENSLTFSWDKNAKTPHIILERVPDKGYYKVTVKQSLHKDNEHFNPNDHRRQDRGPYNREILTTMLASISSTPELLMDHMYISLYWDSTRYSTTEYIQVGDCKVRYAKEISEVGNRVFEIIPQ